MIMNPRELLPGVPRDMRQFREEIDRLVDSFGREWPGLATRFPALNIWQDDSNMYVETELPGMNLEGLEIYVTGGDQLTIKGERKAPQVENAAWHRQERGFGSFTRAVTLPVPVDPDAVQARFVHGVLTITLPKSAAARPKKIAVKSE